MKKKLTESFRKYLLDSLKDPIEAAEYINAALREEDVDFLLVVLRDVAEAQGGVLKLSEHTRLNRAHLYKTLSKSGNPRIQTLEAILKSFGLRLGVFADPQLKKAA